MSQFQSNSSWSLSVATDNSGEPTWFADLTPEECDRYLRWWRKFRILDRICWWGIGLGLVAYLAERYHRSDRWAILGIFGGFLILATRIWLRLLDCPRCGATYSGGWITIFSRFVFLDHCHGCDLTTEKLAELKKYADSALR
jgi:hypothetical protein